MMFLRLHLTDYEPYAQQDQCVFGGGAPAAGPGDCWAGGVWGKETGGAGEGETDCRCAAIHWGRATVKYVVQAAMLEEIVAKPARMTIPLWNLDNLTTAEV